MKKQNPYFKSLRFHLRFLRLKIWNCGIKLSWNTLWIRSDEFHPSLNIDNEVMSIMLVKQQMEYISDIARRREIAHKKSLEKRNLNFFQKIFTSFTHK